MEFESDVRVVRFDQVFSCLLVVTNMKIMYVNVNGDVLCERSWGRGDSRVSAATFVGIAMSGAARAGICGMENGGVAIVVLDFVGRRIRFEHWDSLHACPISEFLVHPSKTGLLSIDTEGKVCHWTSNTVAGPALSVGLFLKCLFCDKKPVVVRGKRRRVLCGDCSSQ
jgi:hypothetical protein